jgi:ribosomal protein L11 methyltransferase
VRVKSVGTGNKEPDGPPTTRRGYSRVVVEGTPGDLEQASLSFFEAGCLGVEEKYASTLEAYFHSSAELAPLMDFLSQSYPDLRFGPPESIPDQDWLAAWKSDFHAFNIGKRFCIVPSWETPPKTERHVLHIDPERAFGTGTHETTQLTIEIIEDVVRADSSVIDAGTGTGVLAMACAALGCRQVLAIENDPEAASCAGTNIQRNGFDERVSLLVASVMEAEPRPAEVVLANLNETILRKALPRISNWVSPNGKMILSGLLQDQVDSIVDELPHGFVLVENRTAGEWAALLVAFNAHA